MKPSLEKEVRVHLQNFLLQEKVAPENSLLVPEFCLTHTRADLAVISKYKNIGVEIKSGNDSLSKFEAQAEDYSQHFDECWACVHPKHMKNLQRMLPPHWGVLGIVEGENSLTFMKLKEPEKNPDFNIHRLLNHLWQPEVLLAARWLGLTRKMGNCEYRRSCYDFLVKLHPKKIHPIHYGFLKQRGAWRELDRLTLDRYRASLQLRKNKETTFPFLMELKS